MLKEEVDVLEPPALDYPMPRPNPLLPPPAYAQLRDQPPRKVRMPNGRPAWLLTRYDDVRAALADPRMSSDFMQPNFPTLNAVPPSPGAFSFVRMDAPDHGRLRRMVTPDFSMRRMRDIRPAVAEMAEELLDKMLAAGSPADMVESFALPLPSMVIARILGVPPEQNAVFQQCSRMIARADSTPEEGAAALGKLAEFLNELANAKKDAPGDDLISRLVHEFEANGELTRYELVAICSLLLFAGHETSANQISISIIYLLDNPEQLAEIRRDPALVRPAMEELLRFASLKQHDLIRVVAEDMQFAGVQMSKGDGVITSQPAANHDPSVFPDPDRLDIHRKTTGHLAFGHGAHACLGASLARVEVEVALELLLRRLPDLALAVGVDQVPFRHDMLIYGVHSLPITW